MTSTTKYVVRYADWVRAAVWKHLNTRRDTVGKSLELMPPDASAWLKAGFGDGLAPVWLRDRMLEGAKTQLVYDWDLSPLPVGDPTGEPVWTPEEPGPNQGVTAASERDTFAEWVEHAIVTRLVEHTLNDGHGKLLAMPLDVQKWLDNSSAALAPTSVLTVTMEALDDLDWD